MPKKLRKSELPYNPYTEDTELNFITLIGQISYVEKNARETYYRAKRNNDLNQMIKAMKELTRLVIKKSSLLRKYKKIIPPK